MNALSPVRTRTTPQRLRFSQADVDLMVRQGLLAENARVELIDGDLIEMASECGVHTDHKGARTQGCVRHRPPEFALAPDATLRLGDHDAPEPDLYVFPDAMRGGEASGPDVALVIEISDTTQSFDLRRKAQLYARFEVREYWVLDAPARRVHVHTAPGVAGYEDVVVLGYADVLSPTAIPGLHLRLDDLERLRR